MPDGQLSGIEDVKPCFAPCASIPNQPWQVIHSHPHQERAIEHRIRSQGGVVWWPMESARRSNRQTVLRGIFPRYLFSQNYEWPVVRNAGGEEMGRVLLSPSRIPLNVPATEMAKLFAQCGPNGVVYPPEVRARDRVTIAEGPFVGFSGICSRSLRDRIWVLLSLFGRDQEVPFSRQQVELAGP